ncbi:hypothetical protein AZO1586I_213 [Bathymodiolus thermophilus thioautotrophic gill symbiont]|jgi:hypothetical protein|uniref:Transposase n=1 Tax=Bathymodiolus thermophilus thioautotrophic gill symbiont TaxID=2360 RepID=A0ABM8M5K9_9GAMM|nr:hypothetical protein AZO1586I_213 [Bathymodiolus thermophilus thioautotrophic gill symbiont]CAC9519635.1 hypothetical protein [uncultured Gammaproteobacteria bacterium]CAC9988121.1 hypothetical protein [uncultured Gammaproteobacteria bacterium]
MYNLFIVLFEAINQKVKTQQQITEGFDYFLGTNLY